MPTLPRRTTAIALLVLVIAAAGCAGATPSLDGRAFLSVAVTDGGAARPLVAGTRIRLDFRGSDLGASAGCNSIGGTVRIEDGRLVFEGGAMTEMACDADRMAQDDWLVALLGSRPAIRLAGDELRLESGSIVVRLMDRKVVDPDLALTGRAWTVESVIAGDAVSSVPDGVSATLTFNGNGSLDLDAGCNQGGGAWVAAGAGIRITDLVLTKKACEGAGARLEAAVLAVLRAETVAASIEANVLTLQAAGGGLQLRAS
jgi:heat shock protein HslJ